ncbi:MAG: hypothetical protein HY854_01795 [Burkholderiales bacterium]|nr:hypothetical protein [Burkholderiales bacterium]
MLRQSLIAIALLVCLDARAAPQSLDEIMKGFGTCEFGDFYYDMTERTPHHPYLARLAAPPKDAKGDLYTFRIADRLWGMPVVEIRVPGTWGYHSVTFDVPLAEARRIIRGKFGSEFRRSKRSMEGEKPALEALPSNPKQSVFYCNELEGGL